MPSLSDPYSYWALPTSNSTTFSSPWTPEEEEFWGKTGESASGPSVLGLNKRGHRRTCLGRYSTVSIRESFSNGTGSGSKAVKMDSHFPHGVVPTSVGYPLQSASPRQQQALRHQQKQQQPQRG